MEYGFSIDRLSHCALWIINDTQMKLPGTLSERILNVSYEVKQKYPTQILQTWKSIKHRALIWNMV
jgi:hypothetical protein